MRSDSKSRLGFAFALSWARHNVAKGTDQRTQMPEAVIQASFVMTFPLQSRIGAQLVPKLAT